MIFLSPHFLLSLNISPIKIGLMVLIIIMLIHVIPNHDSSRVIFFSVQYPSLQVIKKAIPKIISKMMGKIIHRNTPREKGWRFFSEWFQRWFLSLRMFGINVLIPNRELIPSIMMVSRSVSISIFILKKIKVAISL